MEIPKHYYGVLIDTLDQVRAESREAKPVPECKTIKDELLLIIERNGFCKYIINGGKCYRTLTDNGIELLASTTYANYLKNKAWRKRLEWIPVVISVLAFGISLYAAFSKPKNYLMQTPDTTQTIRRLNLSLDSLKKEVFVLQGYQMLLRKETNKARTPVLIGDSTD